MAVAKERTNLYINKALKVEAQEKLEKYGMNLSSFVNVMLAKFLQKDVDMLIPPETEDVIKDFEHQRSTFEEPISLEKLKNDL
jgi:antitoxin component of RelBE/YafQ-DinJ toxin-antitoxin module